MHDNVTRVAVILSFTLAVLAHSIAPCGEAIRNPAFASSPSGAENEETSWAQVKKTNRESLQSFLIAFPDGKYSETARTLVLLLDKMGAIRAGQSRPTAMIAFEKLMPTWRDWKETYKNSGGFYKFYEQNGPVRLADTTLIDSQTGAIAYVNSKGSWVGPTADDSIIMFQSKDDKSLNSPDGDYLLCGIRVRVTSQKPMYWGVIDGIGLVHLQGAGEVTVPGAAVMSLE